MHARLPLSLHPIVVVLLLAVCTAPALAAVHDVVAFSSSAHFRCGDGRPPTSGLCEGALISEPLAARATSDLVGALAGQPASDALPAVAARVATAVEPARVVLSVTSLVADSPKALLSRISEVFAEMSASEGHSSFVGTVEGPLSARNSALSLSRVGGKHVSPGRLAEMAKESSFAPGSTQVVSVRIENMTEHEALFPSIRSLMKASDGHIGLVWAAARAEDVKKQEEAAEDSAKKGAAAGNAAADAVEANAAGKGVTAAPTASTSVTDKANSTTNSTIPGFAADGALLKTTSMNPPELSTAGLMGLLVTVILLIILAPGLFCLYSIEAPMTFDQMDKDEAKKKMQ